MHKGSSLVGKEREIGRLAELTRAVGRGGALVLRGEPGIGKSALPEHVREAASGFLVLEAGGVEFESELPFAALHQLCVPILPRFEKMPEPLRVTFGLAGGKPEVFRVGLADR